MEVLCRLHSDHNPLLLRFGGLPLARGPRPFRFKATWIDYGEYADFISRAWNFANHNTIDALNNVRENSISFNHDVFGNIFKRKKHIENRLEGIQNYLERADPLRHSLIEKELQQEYIHILFQEEMFWYQKSRENWVKFGDKNSSFFHAQTIIRRNKKKIEFIGFSSQMVFGPPTPPSSKKKPKDFSRIFSAVLTNTKTATSMWVPTPLLMMMVKIPSPNPSPKKKFQQLLTP